MLFVDFVKVDKRSAQDMVAEIGVEMG
ncbi:hypothetical protein HKBW3S09_01582, partial [Candidatus Hakubella thermalkaliphila]